MEKNILISIVVPTYNNEKFIDKCVESILSQTYHEFELLIINDGSTDNTINVLQPYLKKEQRIKLHNTKNKGVSSARNLGISKAKGEYICFIDSDDWVEKDYLSQFVSKIKNPKISPVNPVLTWNFGKDPALTAFFGLLGSKRTSG